jgi:hypothetical protein
VLPTSLCSATSRATVTVPSLSARASSSTSVPEMPVEHGISQTPMTTSPRRRSPRLASLPRASSVLCSRAASCSALGMPSRASRTPWLDLRCASTAAAASRRSATGLARGPRAITDTEASRLTLPTSKHSARAAGSRGGRHNASMRAGRPTDPLTPHTLATSVREEYDWNAHRSPPPERPAASQSTATNDALGLRSKRWVPM